MINKRLFIAKLLHPLLSLILSKKGIVPITLHNIEKKHYAWFQEFIEMVHTTYGFIDFKDIKKNTEVYASPKVLLTFDDGFYSNKDVSEKFLTKYKIKAIFFITEGFIGLNSADSFTFSDTNFYPESKNHSDFDSQRSMTWEDVLWLKKHGHSIGAHTKNHKNLSMIKDKDQLFDEIVLSSQRIEEKLNLKVDTFAFPFGTPNYITKNALKVAQEHFDFIFSNVRGNLNSSPSNFFIFRQNIVPGDPMWLIKMIIEGKMDWKYKNIQRKSYEFFE